MHLLHAHKQSLAYSIYITCLEHEDYLCYGIINICVKFQLERLNVQKKINSLCLQLPFKKYNTKINRKKQESPPPSDNLEAAAHRPKFISQSQKISTGVMYLLRSALLLAELAKSLIYGQHQRGCILGRFVTGGS